MQENKHLEKYMQNNIKKIQKNRIKKLRADIGGREKCTSEILKHKKGF